MPSGAQQEGHLTAVYDMKADVTRYHDYFSLMAHFNIDSTRSKRYDTDIPKDERISLFSQKMSDLQPGNDTDAFNTLCDDVLLNYRFLMQVLYNPDSLFEMLDATLKGLPFGAESSADFASSRSVYLCIAQALPDLFRDLGPGHERFILHSIKMLRLQDVSKYPEIFIAAIQSILLSLKPLNCALPAGLWQLIIEHAKQADRILWPGLAEIPAYLVRAHARDPNFIQQLFISINGLCESVMANLVCLLACRRTDGTLLSRTEDMIASFMTVPRQDAGYWFVELLSLFAEAELTQEALGEVLNIFGTLAGARLLRKEDGPQEAFLSAVMFYSLRLTPSGAHTLYRTLSDQRHIFEASFYLLTLCLLAVSTVLHTEESVDLLGTFFQQFAKELQEYDNVYVLLEAVKDFSRHHKRDIFITVFLDCCARMITAEHSPYIYIHLYHQSVCDQPTKDQVSACIQRISKDLDSTSVDTNGVKLCTVLAILYTHALLDKSHVGTVQAIIRKLDPAALEAFTAGKSIDKPDICTTQGVMVTLLLSILIQISDSTLGHLFDILGSLVDAGYDSLIGPTVTVLCRVPPQNLYRTVLRDERVISMLTSPCGILRRAMLQTMGSLENLSPCLGIIGQYVKLFPMTNVFDAQALLMDIQKRLTAFLEVFAVKGDKDSSDSKALMIILAAATCGLLYMRFAPVTEGAISLIHVLAEKYPAEASYVFERYMWKLVFNIEEYDLKNEIFEAAHEHSMDAEYPFLYTMGGEEMEDRVYHSDNRFRARIMTITTERIQTRLDLLLDKLTTRVTHLLANTTVMPLLLGVDRITYMGINAILPADSLKIVPLLAEKAIWLPNFSNIISDTCLEGLVSVYAKRIELGNSDEEYEGSQMHSRVVDLMTKMFCPMAKRMTEASKMKLIDAMKIAFSTASLEYMGPHCVILYYFLTGAPFIHVLARLINLQTCTDQLLGLRFTNVEYVEEPYTLDKSGFNDLHELCTKKLTRKQMYEKEYGGITLINAAHRDSFIGIALYIMAGRVVRTGRSFSFISGVANAAIGGRSVGSDDSRRRVIFSFAEQTMTPRERNRLYGILIMPIFTKLFTDISITRTEEDIISFLLNELDLTEPLALARRVPNAHGNMIRGFCNSCTMMLPYIINTEIVVAYLHIVIILGYFWFLDLPTYPELEDWYSEALTMYRNDAIVRNEVKKYPQQDEDIGGAEIDLIRSTILQTLKAFVSHYFDNVEAEMRLRAAFGSDERRGTLFIFKHVYGLISAFYSENSNQLCPYHLTGTYAIIAKYPFLAERYLAWNYRIADDILVHLRPHIKQDLAILRVFTVLANAFLDECERDDAHVPEYEKFRERLPEIKQSFAEKILHCLRKRLSPKYFKELTIGYILPENIISSLHREALATLHILLLCDSESDRFSTNNPAIEELCEVFHYALNTDNQTVVENVIKFYEFVVPLCSHNLLLPLVLKDKLAQTRLLLSNLYKKYGAVDKISTEALSTVKTTTGITFTADVYVNIYNLLYKLGVLSYELRAGSIQEMAAYFCHSKMAVGVVLHFLTEGIDSERSAASTVLRAFALQAPTGDTDMEAWRATQALVINYVHAYINQGIEKSNKLDNKHRKGRSELLQFLQVFAGYGTNWELVHSVRDMFVPAELDKMIEEDVSFNSSAINVLVSAQTIGSIKCLVRPDYFCLYQLTDFVKLANTSTTARIGAFKNVFTFLCRTLLGRCIMSNVFACRYDWNILTNILIPMALAEYLAPDCSDEFEAIFLEFVTTCGLYLDWSRYRLVLIYLLSQLDSSSNEGKLLKAINSFLNDFRFSAIPQSKDGGDVALEEESAGDSDLSESDLEDSDPERNRDGNIPLDGTTEQGGDFNDTQMIAHTSVASVKFKDAEGANADKEFDRAVSNMRTVQYVRKGDFLAAGTILSMKAAGSGGQEGDHLLNVRNILTEALNNYSPNQVMSQLSRVFIPRVHRCIAKRLGTNQARYRLATTLSKLIAKLPFDQRYAKLSYLIVLILKDLSSTDQTVRDECRQCISHIAMLLGAQNLGTVLFLVRSHCAKEFIGVHLASYVFYDILEHMIMIPRKTLMSIIKNPSIITKLPYNETIGPDATPLPGAITQSSLRQIIAVVVRELFSTQAHEQKTYSVLRLKHAEVGESRSNDIIRLTAASLSFSGTNQIVSFIEPLFRGCAYSFSSKQQDQIVYALLSGWRENSTVTEQSLLDFVHYMMSSKCFYNALMPQIIDVCNKLTSQERLVNARVEGDDLRRARAITDIRNEHMLLEPAPKRLYQGITSISGGFSGVGSSYDTTVPHKIVAALLQHGIESTYGSAFAHVYQPYLQAIVKGSDEQVRDLSVKEHELAASAASASQNRPTISIERYPEIADYVLLMLSSRTAFCRACGFHSLAAMMPSYPVIRTKLIGSECCKALYRTSDKQELEACFRLIDVIMTQGYDLFEANDYALIIKVCSLMIHKNTKFLLAYNLLTKMVKKSINVPEIYETMEYFCKNLGMMEDKAQAECVVEALSCFIVTYEMTSRKRINFIRSLLKVASEFESNAGRITAFTCLKRIYIDIDAETLAGCADITVVSFVVAVHNCLQLKEAAQRTIKEAMNALILFIKRCEVVEYPRCPLHFIRSILLSEKSISHQTNTLVLLSCLAEAILGIAGSDTVDETVADAAVSALTVLLNVVIGQQSAIFNHMLDFNTNTDFSAAAFRLFGAVLQLLSLAPEFANDYEKLMEQLQGFFQEAAYQRTLISAPLSVRARATLVCNIILSQAQDSAAENDSPVQSQTLLPYIHLLDAYIFNISDHALAFDRHHAAQLLGTLLLTLAIAEKRPYHKIINTFRLLDTALIEIEAQNCHLKVSLIGAVLCFLSNFQAQNKELLWTLTNQFIQTLLRLRHYHTVEMDPRYESEQEFEERNPDVLHDKQVCNLVNSTLEKMEQIYVDTKEFIVQFESAERAVAVEKLRPPERRFRRPAQKNAVLEAMLKASYSISDRHEQNQKK